MISITVIGSLLSILIIIKQNRRIGFRGALCVAFLIFLSVYAIRCGLIHFFNNYATDNIIANSIRELFEDFALSKVESNAIDNIIAFIIIALVSFVADKIKDFNK